MAWKDNEVNALISIWGDDLVQAQLEGCKLAYEKVSESMKKAGFERSAVQCREKVKKLKTEYWKIKDKHRVTGTGRKKWKHYDTLDAVLGDRPTTLPPVIVDTLQESIESASETDLDNSTENDIHGEQSSNESIVTVATESIATSVEKVLQMMIKRNCLHHPSHFSKQRILRKGTKGTGLKK